MKVKDDERAMVHKKIEEAMNDMDPFIVLTAGRESLVMVGGTLPEISRMISVAMSKAPEFRQTVEIAVHALEAADCETEKETKRGFEPLKCDTCHKKDDCAVKEMKESLTDKLGKEPMELLQEMLADVIKSRPADAFREKSPFNIKTKGEC